MFNDLTSSLITIAVLVVIGLCIWAFIAQPMFRWLLFTILGVIVLVSGVVTGYYNYVYFTTSGRTFGDVMETLSNLPTLITTKELNEWQFDSLGFSSTGTEFEYESKTNLTNSIDVDLENKTYTLLINGEETISLEQENNHMEFTYSQAFYDFDKNLIFTDTLYINIATYDTSSILLLKTKGGSDAVKMWRNYQQKNGLNLKLVEKVSLSQSNEIITDVAPTEFKGTFSGGTIIADTSTIGTVGTTKFVTIKVLLPYNIYSYLEDKNLYLISNVHKTDGTISEENVKHTLQYSGIEDGKVCLTTERIAVYSMTLANRHLNNMIYNSAGELWSLGSTNDVIHMYFTSYSDRIHHYQIFTMQ